MELKQRLTLIFNSEKSTEQKLQQICKLLFDEVEYYNWVGFYFKNGAKDELKLGPYEGAATDHTIIPYGKGICGQVAVSNQNFVVPDVSAEHNYLSCSIETKSEVVIPVFQGGENIGQIDIDSHFINPFKEEDILLLEWICLEVGKLDLKNLL